MSVHVYLDEKVKDKVGYEVVERGEKGGQRWKEYKIDGMYLYREKGRPHISLGDVEDAIPEKISDIVVGVSVFDLIPLKPKRLCGRYFHETAAGVLDISGDRFALRIVAEKIEDLRELYYKIRSGTIIPKENWEAEQISAPSEKPPEPTKKDKGFWRALRSFITRK